MENFKAMDVGMPINPPYDPRRGAEGFERAYLDGEAMRLNIVNPGYFAGTFLVSPRDGELHAYAHQKNAADEPTMDSIDWDRDLGNWLGIELSKERDVPFVLGHRTNEKEELPARIPGAPCLVDVYGTESTLRHLAYSRRVATKGDTEPSDMRKCLMTFFDTLEGTIHAPPRRDEMPK